ncbi:MAG: hypothetical protein LBU18_02085 [Treponema sp.]|jgi:hypothetical protein|nr:hypothetical protein [Treponema sp.]
MKNPIFSRVLIIAAILCLLLICWSAVRFEAIGLNEIPGSFIGAALGAAITGVITVILLRGQAAAEEKKERTIKIFQGQLKVYSKFMEHLWGMFSDEEVTREELIQLRNICFQQLVFYLKDEDIKKITKQIKEISEDRSPIDAASQITFILKKTLKLAEDKTDEKSPKDNLRALFKSFGLQKKLLESTISVSSSIVEQNVDKQPADVQSQKPVNYWHFAMFSEEQIKQLESGNNVLALFEYGESWRTEQVQQVQSGDVVFLFKRGGAGYIGAFKAEGSKVIVNDEKYDDNYTDDDIERYDMYKRVSEDDADYAANIIVKPLAFNYKGVGCKSVRRKTIDRIKDTEAITYLLARFSGKELSEEQKDGMNKFESGKKVAIEPADQMFFQKLVDEKIG